MSGSDELTRMFCATEKGIQEGTRGVLDRALVCHLGDPGSNLGQANFLQWLWLCRDLHSTPFCAPVSKLGGETPSRIRAWSLIRSEKPIVLFERHCHATEKSEAIACARSDPKKKELFVSGILPRLRMYIVIVWVPNSLTHIMIG
jgi:hypothetical protein